MCYSGYAADRLIVFYLNGNLAYSIQFQITSLTRMLKTICPTWPANVAVGAGTIFGLSSRRFGNRANIWGALIFDLQDGFICIHKLGILSAFVIFLARLVDSEVIGRVQIRYQGNSILHSNHKAFTVCIWCKPLVVSQLRRLYGRRRCHTWAFHSAPTILVVEAVNVIWLNAIASDTLGH